MRDRFVKTLCTLAESDKNIYLLTGDLGFGVLDKFWNKYPDHFINAGICEQNMTSVAAGIALEGKTVYTYSIANFPTMRCLEQIRNDVAYHNANVKIVAVGAGFAYGALGMSHHATEDIAIMRAIPNMTVFTPCDLYETEAVTKMANEIKGPCYIRLGRGKEQDLHKGTEKIVFGEANCLREGKDTVICVAGAIANEAIAAAEQLKQAGISCTVFSFPSVKPIDKKCILTLANRFKVIYTLEEHNIVGGFGSAVMEVTAEAGKASKIIRFGLQDTFTSVVGSQKYLRNYYGMSADKIVAKIKQSLDK